MHSTDHDHTTHLWLLARNSIFRALYVHWSWFKSGSFFSAPCRPAASGVFFHYPCKTMDTSLSICTLICLPLLATKEKKALFFSLSLWMEWEDHHWEEESRKHRNIRQSAAPPPKLINLLSSRFWLWREHISAAFTTTGGTSMLKGRELFHSIREGISHSSSRTLQLPPSSKEKQVMGWKSTGRRTKLFFSLYATVDLWMCCWDLHTNWPFSLSIQGKLSKRNVAVSLTQLHVLA